MAKTLDVSKMEVHKMMGNVEVLQNDQEMLQY